MLPSWVEPTLEKFRVADLTGCDGYVTNFMGIKTRTDLFPHLAGLSGSVRGNVPIPDDGVYGGAIEYASALLGVDQREDRGRYNAVELGAGWGPWISAAGIAADRAGFERVDLVGVEASRLRVEAMRRHIADNHLDRFSVRLIDGAAWSRDTTLFFPREMPLADHGGGVATESAAIDYRGLAYDTEAVKAYSLPSICSGLEGPIDYMHWDIQGAEREVAVWSRDFLDARVRFLFIGTHSRAIEGALMELFFGMGWELLYQSPCAFAYDRAKPTLEGMTTTDGDMLWRNPRV